MKTLLSAVLLLSYLSFSFAQTDFDAIRNHDRFESKTLMKDDSRIVTGSINYSKLGLVEGYFVYSSETEVPEFQKPYKLRFASINEKGKLQTKMLKLGAIDHFQVGEDKYEVINVKIGNPLLGGFSMKNAICRTLDDFNRSRLIRAYSDDDRDEKFMDVIYLKEKEKFIATEGALGGFRKHFQKTLGNDCEDVSDFLAEIQEESEGKSIIKKVMTDNSHRIGEVLNQYDNCE